MSSPDKSHGAPPTSFGFIGCINYLLDASTRGKAHRNPLESVKNMQAETRNVMCCVFPVQQLQPRASQWWKVRTRLCCCLFCCWEKLEGQLFLSLWKNNSFRLLVPLMPLTAAASCFHHSEKELESLWNTRTDWRYFPEVDGKEISATELPGKKLSVDWNFCKCVNRTVSNCVRESGGLWDTSSFSQELHPTRQDNSLGRCLWCGCIVDIQWKLGKKCSHSVFKY